MESVNPLEKLQELEKKVDVLIELLKTEREAKIQLAEENDVLGARLQSLENSLVKETKSIEDFNQERTLTKMLVDELIANIDKLVDGQQEVRSS